MDCTHAKLLEHVQLLMKQVFKFNPGELQMNSIKDDPLKRQKQPSAKPIKKM